MNVLSNASSFAHSNERWRDSLPTGRLEDRVMKARERKRDLPLDGEDATFVCFQDLSIWTLRGM